MSTKVCPECGRDNFSRSAELKRHMDEVHGAKRLCPYGCPWIGTKRLARYREHIKKHHGTTPDIVLHVPEGFSDYAAALWYLTNPDQ